MNKIIAFVGMPGAGKSEATNYVANRGIKTLRFGDFTEEHILKAGLELNPENEKIIREKLRKEMGMDAYAIMIKPRIDKLLKTEKIVVLDGLYSWEEYKYLKKYYLNLSLIYIFAEPNIRYKRLSVRKIRPLTLSQARERDIREIEKLNKAGPIAVASFAILNNSNRLEDFHKDLDKIIERLEI